MVRNRTWLVVGVALTAAGLYLFARFWAIAGAETPPGQSGILSGLDWGTFFVSPLLVFGGLLITLWAALSGRSRRQPAPASAATLAQMRVLESTH